jgi:hypothetical protein
MVAIYDITTKAPIDADFKELIEGYESLQAISFVASFSTIDKQLLPQFQQIQLILGKEDSATASRAVEVLSKPHQLAKQLGSFKNEAFMSRMLDESLQLRFTKDRLFHTKLYILRKGDHYRVMQGSMNLTDRAQNHNHEMLWVYDGTASDELIAHHLDLFQGLWTNESAEFLDRKVIPDIIGQGVEQIKYVLTNQLTDEIIEGSHGLKREEIQAVLEVEPETDVQYELETIAVETAKVSYTSAGVRKRTEQTKFREQIKQVMQVRVAEGEVYVDEIERHDDIWRYDTDKNEIVVFKDGESTGSVLTTDEVTKTDAEVFAKVIESYRANKFKDERASLMTGFLYLMTSPLIWRIREIFEEHRLNREDIPVFLVMMGQGQSGKSNALNHYFRPFVGADGKAIDASNENAFTHYSGHQNQRRVKHIQAEIGMDKVVSPTFLDEVAPEFFDNNTAINMFKSVGNSRMDAHRTCIMASNASMSGLKKELQKRIQYVSIVGEFRKAVDCPIDYLQLSSQITDHIYREVVSRLNDRLADPNEADIQAIRNDYLSITREILRDIMDSHGIELDEDVWAGFDYVKDKARKQWPVVIRTADPKHIMMTRANRHIATITEHVFKQNTGYRAGGPNKEMEAYADMLPKGVVTERADNCIEVDIDLFDEAVGDTVLRDLWEDKFRTDMTVDAVKRQQDATQETLGQVVQMLAEREAKPKKGFFGRIFGK